MPDTKFLSIFTPSRTPPEDLEAINVQRHELLDDALERIEESATSGNKHHLLFYGPRGTGKTHLVTLLVHRLGEIQKLNKHLHIAWLNEDETSTTLFELLRRIYVALCKRYPNEYQQESLDPMFEMDFDQAEQWLTELLLKKLGNRTLLVVVENLDALLKDMGKKGQQHLRAFIQEHPVLSIVATAQRLIDDISKRENTFFGFFQTEQLQTLTVDDATKLLSNIATLNKQTDTRDFLQSTKGRARIQALHHLSGGNHRIYIVLSQFITRDNIDALITPFSKMIDEMTPYYQERIRWLPIQQRKIVEYLCTCKHPIPVKDMARQLFASHQTISSQLKDLRKKGYVKSTQRGRESLYEIAEPLMRICVEVKENQSHEPLRVIVDFLRVWYDERDLSKRLRECSNKNTARVYLESALEINSTEGNLRAHLLVDKYKAELGKEYSEHWHSRIESYAEESEELTLACGEWAKGNKDQALSILTEIFDNPDSYSTSVRGSALLLSNEIYFEDKQLKEAISKLTTLIELPDATVDQVAKALINRGVTYNLLEQIEQAITDYTTLIELPGAPVDLVARALLNRGVAHHQLQQTEQTVADHTTLIELPDAPLDQVARALFNRGVTYSLLEQTEQEIADYTNLIELPDAPVNLVARALLNRGVAYRQLQQTEQEIADYANLIELPGAPVDQVARALFNRGLAYRQLQQTEQAIADFTTLIDLPYAPIEDRVDAYFELAEIHFTNTQWNSAIETLNQGLTEGCNQSPPYIGNIKYILELLYNDLPATKIFRQLACDLANTFRNHNQVPSFTGALIEHLGWQFTTERESSASTDIELWASIWESTLADIPEAKLPLRIFRTGVDFIKAGGNDESILLNLNQEERRILEQVLKLNTK